MSDNLLTSVIRAWDTDASIDMKKKIILVAPAMNSVASLLFSFATAQPTDTLTIAQAMWRNPITEKQIRVLADDWGVRVEEAVAGTTRSIVGWFQVLTVSISLNYTSNVY